MRRTNRREAWKDKQEKIRLGLEPPPEPKVKKRDGRRWWEEGETEGLARTCDPQCSGPSANFLEGVDWQDCWAMLMSHLAGLSVDFMS